MCKINIEITRRHVWVYTSDNQTASMQNPQEVVVENGAYFLDIFMDSELFAAGHSIADILSAIWTKKKNSKTKHHPIFEGVCYLDMLSVGRRFAIFISITLIRRSKHY